MEIDTSRWSGDGALTAALVRVLNGVAGVRFVRVEDAPASRVDAGYSFVSNEIYVTFDTRPVVEHRRLLGILRLRRRTWRKMMSLDMLERILAAAEGIGRSDYMDEGLLQYLRTERIVPPYQTRGYKQVELVRVYEAAATVTG